MIGYTFRPIQQWPREFTRKRTISRFKASYRTTIAALTNELRHVKARNIVIQLALKDEDIRLDGLPRANSRPLHPGVILSYETAEKAYSMPCDQYTDWESNLRAIGLTLQALRSIDRYGVTQNAEQYQGWEALPVASTRDKEEAAKFLREHSGIVITATNTDAVLLKKAYQAAARKLHPDVSGTGDHELFIELTAAYELLCEAEGKG